MFNDRNAEMVEALGNRWWLPGLLHGQGLVHPMSCCAISEENWISHILKRQLHSERKSNLGKLGFQS